MGKRDGIGRLVKEIAYWDGKKAQSIWLDTDASKRSSEEVAKAIDVSLNQIDNYRSYGGRTLLCEQTKDSTGGGVTESFSSKLKNIGHIIYFYRIVNCCLHAQSKALQKILENVYGAGGIGEVSFMQLLHTLFSKQEYIGEDFKDI